MKKYTTACLVFAACLAVDIDDEELEEDSEGGLDYRTAIYWGDESFDKCCNLGTDVNCVDDANNTCGANKSLITCLPCNWQECTDGESWGQYGWHTNVDGSPWECRGFSLRNSSGAMIDDDCNTEACIGEACIDTTQPSGWDCTVPDDWTDEYGTNHIDGQTGDLCCKPDGLKDNDHVCTYIDGPCAVDGYTMNLYCLPCPGVDQGDPAHGAWDLTYAVANDDGGHGGEPGEWGHSMDCGYQGVDGKYSFEGSTCRIVEYECGGILVGTGGTLVSEDCAGWP